MSGNGSSGGRPLPTAIKLLRGNPGKRRMNLTEPAVEVGEPQMPEHLLPAARAEWTEIVPDLLTLGVLAKIDRGALAAYCTCHAMALEAEAAIAKKGVLVEEIIYNRDGDEVGRKTKRNPAIQVLAEMLRIKKSYLTEFGLTPASRVRLRVEKPVEPDPMDLYLAGRRDQNGQLKN